MDFDLGIYYELFRPINHTGNLHYHGFYEIVYYKDGNGFTTINGNTYHYSPGKIAFLPPYVKHDEFCEKDSTLHILTFTCMGTPDPALKCGLYSDKDGSIYHCICKIRDEYCVDLPLMNQFTNIFCQELYYTILRSNDESSSLSNSLSYVIGYINKFNNEDLRVTNLAEMCGYSERHFRQIFKNKTGYSPTEYILKRRVDNAKLLLIYTDESISNVSSKCGFCSSSQFALLFRKETGLTPKEFRKKKIAIRMDKSSCLIIM